MAVGVGKAVLMACTCRVCLDEWGDMLSMDRMASLSLSSMVLRALPSLLSLLFRLLSLLLFFVDLGVFLGVFLGVLLRPTLLGVSALAGRALFLLGTDGGDASSDSSSNRDASTYVSAVLLPLPPCMLPSTCMATADVGSHEMQ